jgi:hypothetical protein
MCVASLSSKQARMTTSNLAAFVQLGSCAFQFFGNQMLVRQHSLVLRSKNLVWQVVQRVMGFSGALLCTYRILQTLSAKSSRPGD